MNVLDGGSAASVDEQEARELLVELVQTPSVSGNEAACADVLCAFFESHGRERFRDEVGNVQAPGDDGVLLTSHLDTVPGEIPVRIEETEDGERALWGRGSVDAKGSLAAMAVVSVRTGASCLGVVGEEVDSRGSRHALETRDPPDALINGEPSGWDATTLGYRGMMTGTYTAATDSTHTSRPENNAIQDAIEWYDRVESSFDGGESNSSHEQETFECVTCKPTTVDGGTASDGLAVEVTMQVQFRVPPGETTDTVKANVEAALDGGHIEWEDAVEPVVESPRTPVARAFRVAIRDHGGEPRLLRKTGTSDMNVFAEVWDCPMVTYGPGDSAMDHTPNEHLVLSEYDRAVRVLTDATTRLL